MKRLSFIAVLAMFTFVAEAQEPKFAPVDASPADIVYFPLNAAKAKDDSTPSIKIIYSRPTKKGREIFGVLEQFDKVWRVGANESTEIKFYKRVNIGGKSVKAGSYSLFAIPNQDKWTLIINKQTDRWGAFTYDQNKDVVRVDVPVKTLDKPLESFSITFTAQPQGTNMVLAWDRTLVELPIVIK
ncbi:MAG: DUF2911 domain-containing protein [Candidatus Pedobacter colombiensis]|uniref:DUF2911 domain-containing protein n=1 Tax=Candidatus Pedobacter colombiensis TaxID=3121371 RepID=A0AAJ5W708_9SPHI|nr:DUF2911 domain-containing protein [Pedobacter sp.]WEK19281.1 MAG: DUF2911 domain-containing protein [Pedobacter sp.]